MGTSNLIGLFEDVRYCVFHQQPILFGRHLTPFMIIYLSSFDVSLYAADSRGVQFGLLPRR